MKIWQTCWPSCQLYFLTKRQVDRPYLKPSISRVFCFNSEHFFFISVVTRFLLTSNLRDDSTIIAVNDMFIQPWWRWHHEPCHEWHQKSNSLQWATGHGYALTITTITKQCKFSFRKTSFIYTAQILLVNNT